MKIKTGFKSSEFYVAMTGIVALVWQQVQSRCNFDTPFLLGVGGVVISYIIGRSYIKAQK